MMLVADEIAVSAAVIVITKIDKMSHFTRRIYSNNSKMLLDLNRPHAILANISALTMF
jgi:hypothetical protein